MKKTQVGVIRWDAYVDSDRFFGTFASNSLSPKEYQNRAPFYSRITEEGRVTFSNYNEDLFNQEMEYAISAGIDYFAYCYYSFDCANAAAALDYDPARKAIAPYIDELTIVRRMHRKSTYREKVKLCAILTSFPLTALDVAELAEDMVSDYYVKVDGRPLLYCYETKAPVTLANLALLLPELEKAGVPAPIMVPTYPLNANTMAEQSKDEEAVGFYAAGNNGFVDYESYCAKVSGCLENYFRIGKPVVPLLAMGWNPDPRVDHPVSWASYARVQYHEEMTEAGLQQQVAKIRELVQQYPDRFMGHCLVFAWNEFEEGGWVCPTLAFDEEGKPFADCTHLEYLGRAIKALKA